jgi:hypothetical protein
MKQAGLDSGRMGPAPVCHEHLEEARDEALEEGTQISEVRLT